MAAAGASTSTRPSSRLSPSGFGVEPADAQRQDLSRPFLGLRIRDVRLATLTRRVLMISALAAIFVVISTSMRVLLRPGGRWHRRGGRLFPSVLMSLILPVIGYLGARKSNARLTCLFCGASFVSGLCNALGMFHFAFVYTGFKFVVEHCDPSTAAAQAQDSYCPGQEAWHLICPRWTPDECYATIVTRLPRFHTALIIGEVFLCFSLILHCVGFVWGRQLHVELKRGAVLHDPPPFATAATTLQPAMVASR